MGGTIVTYLGFLAGRSVASTSLGGIRPTLGVMSLAEAKAFLNGGVVGVNRLQLRNGSRPVSEGLLSGELKYIRRDPQEKWTSVNEIWLAGGGDCEDLVPAVVAELLAAGHLAVPLAYQPVPGVWHVIYRYNDPILGWVNRDPSKLGGMAGAA